MVFYESQEIKKEIYFPSKYTEEVNVVKKCWTAECPERIHHKNAVLIFKTYK